MPFLLALACAAKVASAAALIGKPQDTLIREVLELRFAGYRLESIAPVILGPAALWLLPFRQTGSRWYRQQPLDAAELVRHESGDAPFDRW